MNGELTQKQKAAHLKMMSSLKVHTHLGVYDERGQGKRIETLPPSLVEDVRSMIDAGHSDRVIRIRHRIGLKTLRRIKKAIA